MGLTGQIDNGQIFAGCWMFLGFSASSKVKPLCGVNLLWLSVGVVPVSFMLEVPWWKLGCEPSWPQGHTPRTGRFVLWTSIVWGSETVSPKKNYIHIMRGNKTAAELFLEVFTGLPCGWKVDVQSAELWHQRLCGYLPDTVIFWSKG